MVKPQPLPPTDRPSPNEDLPDLGMPRPVDPDLPNVDLPSGPADPSPIPGPIRPTPGVA